MKEKMIMMVKGFFMGIANIIPGVSGGTLAITMGIYEQLIGAISHFTSHLKKNITFLFWIGLGALLALALGSKAIAYFLKSFPLATLLFFTGLILGGIPMLYKKVKGKITIPYILIFILTFASVIGIMFVKNTGSVSLETLSIGKFGLLFVVGLIASATMIIPGISGSFMLMVLGYYYPILYAINELTSFQNIGHNSMVLLPFGLGIVLGIVVLAKILEFLFQKFSVPTYYGVLGFVLASVIGIFIQTEGLVFSIEAIVLSTVLFFLGFGIAYKLGD